MKALKKLELQLISELLRNSRRSDRELSKKLGVSQPTVSRMIKRLEGQGIIKEYTIIPDFAKIGYQLFTVTLVKHKENLSSKEFSEHAEKALERAKSGESPEMVMAEVGIGLGYDAVILAYARDYSSHREFIDRIRSFQHLEAGETQSFIVNLNGKDRYRPLTHQTLANHVAEGL